MNIEYLGNRDVTELEKTIGFLQVDNPDIKYSVYPMEEKTEDTMEKRICAIETSVARIENMLTNIFGDNILIDGQFINIKTGS